MISYRKSGQSLSQVAPAGRKMENAGAKWGLSGYFFGYILSPKRPFLRFCHSWRGLMYKDFGHLGLLGVQEDGGSNPLVPTIQSKKPQKNRASSWWKGLFLSKARHTDVGANMREEKGKSAVNGWSRVKGEGWEFEHPSWFYPSTSLRTSGLNSAIRMSVFAAPDGSRLPCSHCSRVRRETPSNAANRA